MKIHSVILRGGKQFEGGNAIQQKLHGSSQFGMLQNFFSAFRKYCQKQTREWPLDDSGPHLLTEYFSQVQMTQLQCCVMHTVVIYKAPGFVSIIRKTLFIALLGYTLV